MSGSGEECGRSREGRTSAGAVILNKKVSSGNQVSLFLIKRFSGRSSAVVADLKLYVVEISVSAVNFPFSLTRSLRYNTRALPHRRLRHDGRRRLAHCPPTVEVLIGRWCFPVFGHSAHDSISPRSSVAELTRTIVVIPCGMATEAGASPSDW